MPELPEVETIKNQLQEKILGKEITLVEVRFPRFIKNTTPSDFQRIVQGARIKGVRRRAKILILELSNNWSILIHLKLTGQLIYLEKRKEEEIKKQTHLIYYFADGSLLLHNDLRKFGYAKLVETKDLEKIFAKEKLGPEPLEKDFSFTKFEELLREKGKGKIKPLLMDQSFLAGVGNLYAQEACWWAKILPQREVKTLTHQEIKDLYKSLIKILREAIKYRGTSADTYVDLAGKKGGYTQRLKVYGREGESCFRCRGKIKKINLAGRGTYFCPKCQH